jgi:deoxyribodipyrimidine photo-lyase
MWFRQDLRLHDNEALWEASRTADEIIPIYVFDERVFNGKTSFGFNKTGSFRAQFIIESVENLRASLQKKNLELVVRVGKPEEIISEIAKEHSVSWVYCNRERTYEEVKVQNSLEANLWHHGIELRYSRGKMLYYTADLPFPISHTPDVFTAFRKEVERFISVREPLASERLQLKPIPHGIENGEIPTLKDFGLKPKKASKIQIKGGETEALARLRYYLWETDFVSSYKKTRNGLLGSDYSTKFSAYLSQGCLSPKKIYSEIKAYEDERISNDSTYWVVFELLWRDFFRLMGKKHGNTIFKVSGPKQNAQAIDNVDWEKFEAWKNGETGIPFIDANMKELNATGFMSNRGRQNVASFLVNDLNLNWLLGAEYFESLLLDYDPCSNYGNWNYIAGVGSDPRSDRYFNIYSQAKRYDPKGEFVKHWIPVLGKLPENQVHLPHRVDGKVLNIAGVNIGENYPEPIINTAKWN